MVKLNWLLMIGFLLLVPVAIAQTNTEYTELGLPDGDYRTGEGIFGKEGTAPEATGNVVVTTDSRYYPLVADLDNDGDSEYIILDGNELRIFEDTTLDLIDIFGIQVNHRPITGSERYSNIIAFDIDGDGLTEIIYIKEKNQFLDIIEFNGTDIILQTQFNLTQTTASDESGTNFASEFMIKCQATNKCLLTFIDEPVSGKTGSPLNKQVFAVSFNSTGTISQRSLYSEGAGFALFCWPRDRKIALGDYDNDGKDEMIFSMMDSDVSSSPDEEIRVFFIELQDNGTIELETQFTETANVNDIIKSADGGVTASECNGNGINQNLLGGILNNIPGYEMKPENFFTSPITFDFDGGSGNGQETVIGFVDDEDGDHFDFLIKVYNGCNFDEGFETSCTVEEKDDYPETCDLLNNCGKAHALTNIWRANAFPDDTPGGPIDFCVGGVTFNVGSETDEIDVICGSLQKTQSFGFFQLETMEIILGTENGVEAVPFNITFNTDMNSNPTFHSAQHSDLITDGQNLDEIVTPYGILRIINGGSASPDFEIFFDKDDVDDITDLTDGTMIPVDGENQGSEDLLLYTAGNFFYIDDGLSNQGAIIRNVSFNPCPIDAILKVNTTINIDVIIVDQNPSPLAQDPVTARVSVYNDDPNEFNDLPVQFNNVTSGALLPYTFTLNKTITNGEILIEGFDSINLNDIDTQTFTLNVQANGIEFGDTECSVGFITAEEAEEAEVAIITQATFTQDATENSITTGIQTVIDLTGLAGTTFWLVLMIAFSVGLYFRGASIGWSGASILGAIAFVNAIFLILGARIGVISTALIVIIVVVAVVIIGVFLGKFLTGSGAGTNG